MQRTRWMEWMEKLSTVVRFELRRRNTVVPRSSTTRVVGVVVEAVIDEDDPGHHVEDLVPELLLDNNVDAHDHDLALHVAHVHPREGPHREVEAGLDRSKVVGRKDNIAERHSYNHDNNIHINNKHNK